MFKTLSRLTLIVCVLSISIFSNVSFAYKLSVSEENKYKQLRIKYDNVDDKEQHLSDVRTVLGHLNSGWDDRVASQASNTQVALISGGAAVVSGIVAAVSGGSLLPAAYAAWVSKFKLTCALFACPPAPVAAFAFCGVMLTTLTSCLALATDTAPITCPVLIALDTF